MPSFTEILSTRQNASKARLPALYADFRPLKEHNPEGYAANIKVWQSALASALSERVLSSQSSLVLEVTSMLQEELSSPPWGRPLGLGSVMVCLFLWAWLIVVDGISCGGGVDSIRTVLE
jgi:charged multivesicular body protein 7